MSAERPKRTEFESSRRRLILGLAAAPVAGALLPDVLGGIASAQQQEAKAAAPAGTEPGPHRGEAEALLTFLAIRHGAHLDSAGARELLGPIERSLAGAAEMSAAGLRNSDEPDFIFRPIRRDGAA